MLFNVFYDFDATKTQSFISLCPNPSINYYSSIL